MNEGARGGRGVALLAALGLLLAVGASRAQEPPRFPREIELVVVDVVVTDKSGVPVADLKREDFTVFEDGVRQEIATFEAIRVPAPTTAAASTPAMPPPAPRRPRLVTNAEEDKTPGRFFLIVFDNLHLTPLNAQRAKAAVASFLEKAVREGDLVSLVPTGSGTWWSARMETGRADLIAALKGLEGYRPVEPAGDRLTDYEAMRIYVYQDALVANRVLRRWETYGVTSRREREQERERRTLLMPGVIDLYVESRAAEAYTKVQVRSRTTLNLIARVLAPLGQTRERKAVILVSEGFVFDPSEPAFRNVVEASRRANAPVYFLDTRGLEGLPSLYGVEFGAPIDERDVMSAIADVSREGDGSQLVAEDTGGFSIRNTNDLDSGIGRIARESAVYYLLGYSSSNTARDGRFRRIDVDVRRKGLVLRARKGYYAPREGEAPPTTAADGTDLELQRAFDSPMDLDGMPLRMTAYVLQPTSPGRSRVLLAADADVSGLTLVESEGRRIGTLDVLFGVAHRDSPEVFRSDQKVDLEPRVGKGEGPIWYSIVREFDLTPGTWQARLVVRDVVSRSVGTVTLELDVPPVDSFRVSTPILTDTVQRSEDGLSLAPVVLARRSFRTGGLLYCRFDVFGAATDPVAGQPRVTAEHRLRRAEGGLIDMAPPSRIEPTSIGALSRVLQIPLFRAAPGAYELELTVRDELTGDARRLVEPFTVDPPAAARLR